MKQVFLAAMLGFTVVGYAQESAAVANEITREEVENDVQEIVSEPIVITVSSIEDNSGFIQTVGFDGKWKVDVSMESRKLVLTGGTLKNLGDKTSNKLRMMVYFADKPFDLANPQFIGDIVSTVDVEAIPASGESSSQAFVMKWALQNPLAPGAYFPYILLGEQNPTTQDFEVKDVKVFDQSVTIE